MSALTLQDLLEAGAHFGHQTKRWNPKMKRYILTSRNGIYIVDLNKTLECLDKFIARAKAEVQSGGKVLFVGTKKQIKDCIKEEAVRCGMPYVTERWLGGMLTNFATIRQSVRRLEKIETMEKDGTMEALPKKEVLTIGKKKEKLLTVLSGIRHLRRLPSMVFVVDTIKEHIAVAESRRLEIPIGAIVDTNCDPDEIDLCIPGNDDALKSVQLITKTIADAIMEASRSLKLQEENGEKGEEGAKMEPQVAVEGVETEETEGEVVPAAPGATPADAGARKHRIVRRKMVETPEEE
jgi:small subunit ribosomal protein S2